MSLTQRHEKFWKLHQQGCFVMPNPWDVGSARMMAALGAKALATSSAAHAFTIGRPDMGFVSRDEALAHAQDIVSATSLPVNGDLEHGYGDAPEDVAETIRLAAEAGLSGCSIEDTQMVDGNPAYDFELAVERVAAGVSAARSLAHPFVFCARADGLMNGVYDLDEAIRRVQAFEAAGADLLYVPVLPNKDAILKLIASVNTPINALAVTAVAKCGVGELGKMGVRRISLGSSISRLTHAAIRDATKAMLVEGSFEPLKNGASGNEIDQYLLDGAS